MWMPVNARSSASCRHTSGSYPSAVSISRRTAVVGDLSLKKRRTTERNWSCSSVNANSMAAPGPRPTIYFGMDTGREARRSNPISNADERAERRERHVLLRVPFVALGADVRGAEFAAEDFGRAPFDQFVDVRRGHREQQRHPPRRAVRCLAAAHEPFVTRNRQQQTERKMHEPIVFVARAPVTSVIDRPNRLRDQSSYGTSEYV